MKSDIIQIIAIAVVSVSIIITFVILVLTNKSINTTVVSKVQVEKVPPVPPYYNPTCTNCDTSSANCTCTPIPCLPTNTSNTTLIPCTTQTTCAPCEETPGNATMMCSSVNSGNGIVDSQGNLATPFVFEVQLNNSKTCSGHGTKDATTGTCICEGDLSKCNPNTGDSCVAYSGQNCEIQTVQITKPGNYCLPAYVNACDASTSIVELSQ